MRMPKYISKEIKPSIIYGEYLPIILYLQSHLLAKINFYFGENKTQVFFAIGQYHNVIHVSEVVLYP